MANRYYWCTSLTLLKGLDGNDIFNDDIALVVDRDAGLAHLYSLDDDSGEAEDLPDIALPILNAGTKRWIRVSMMTLEQMSAYIDGETLQVNGSNQFYVRDATTSLKGVLAPSSLDFAVASGVLSRLLPSAIEKVVNFTITADQARGNSVFYNSTLLEINGVLPVGIAGMVVYGKTTVAGALRFTAQTGEVIRAPGGEKAVTNQYVLSVSEAGHSIKLECVATGIWEVTFATDGWLLDGTYPIFSNDLPVVVASSRTALAWELWKGVSYNNQGAAAQVNITLLPGQDGYSFSGYVYAGQMLRFVADGTETFEYNGVESAAGGYVQCSSVGSSIRGRWAGKWIIEVLGVWSVDGSTSIGQNETSPELRGELNCGAHSVGFTVQTVTGDGATTIDWKIGNKVNFTFGAFSETFTFTAPSYATTLTLRLKQDGVGGRLATWPAGILWANKTRPILQTAANAIDIVILYWDGTSYHGASSSNFGVPA